MSSLTLSCKLSHFECFTLEGFGSLVIFCAVYLSQVDVQQHVCREKLTYVKHPEGMSAVGVGGIQHASKHVQKTLERVRDGFKIRRQRTRNTRLCTSWATIECSSSSSGAASPLQFSSVHSLQTINDILIFLLSYLY